MGSGNCGDDSFFLARDFGEAAPTNGAHWHNVNGLVPVGHNSRNEVVTGGGNVGIEIWKWVNISRFLNITTPITYTVPDVEQPLVFRIGARENGLDIDKIAFANADLFYTVSNLEKGEPGMSGIPDLSRTLFVNLLDSPRPVTRVASGALYGITATLPSCIETFVAPLNPNVYVQPALIGSTYHRTFGGAMAVSKRLEGTSGQVIIRLPDICPGWPYQ